MNFRYYLARSLRSGKVKMHQAIAALLTCEDGAGTIDWVVLTATIVGLAITVATLFVSAAGTPEEAYHTNMDAAAALVGTLRQ